jgi:Short C-terminal domain
MQKNMIMKKYILPAIIFIIPFIATAQSNQTFNYYNFKTDKDTIFYNEYKIKPGDTLYLGFGTGFNKDFLYIIQKPTIWNAQSYGGNIVLTYLSSMFSNAYLVFGVMEHKKFFGKKYDYPVFYVNGKEKNKYFADIYNGIKSKEIIALNGVEFKEKTGKTILNKADELKKWKDLLDAGAITKEEYEVEKKKILEKN